MIVQLKRNSFFCAHRVHLIKKNCETCLVVVTSTVFIRSMWSICPYSSGFLNYGCRTHGCPTPVTLKYMGKIICYLTKTKHQKICEACLVVVASTVFIRSMWSICPYYSGFLNYGCPTHGCPTPVTLKYMGKIICYLTKTKHIMVRTVCIFHGMSSSAVSRTFVWLCRWLDTAHTALSSYVLRNNWQIDTQTSLIFRFRFWYLIQLLRSFTVDNAVKWRLSY